MRLNCEGDFSSNIMISQLSQEIITSSKVFQRLEVRLKSVMPELKGKTSQIYLTIKVHESLQDRKGNIIQEIQKKLQQPTSLSQGEVQLNHYISWSTFVQTKQLLKDQYLDNQLYYIIVPEKYLSWAETFAKQQRADSQNKKKIHVLGILKDSVYKDKIKARSKIRIDKQSDYVHYYRYENGEDQKCIEQIFFLVCQHLEQKMRQEDHHIKSWALSNKYAEKKQNKRTVHVYFDNADKATFQSLYRQYNFKSKLSWLQIHPYSSFYDIVKSVEERKALYSKEVGKVNQIVQQFKSKIKQNKSVLNLTSSKSFTMSDSSSHLVTSTIEARQKLDNDDVNIIISRTDFKELDKLKGFVKAQKFKNWELVQINADSPNFYKKITEIFEVGQALKKQQQQQKEQKIIKSRTLFIIAPVNDEMTKQLFYKQDNVFHNMELLLYNSVAEFAILLRQGVKSKENYTIAVMPGGVTTLDYQYEKEIKQFMKQYKASDNFTFKSTANEIYTCRLFSGSIMNEQDEYQGYNLISNEENWLQRIMMERDNFFHPFKGLKGMHVYLLVKSTKQQLLDDLRDYISESPRLHFSSYIDKQYLAKLLQNIQIKDSAIVITDDQCLRQAQEVLLKFDEAFIMNITNRKILKEQVKVFAWGDKAKIFDLIKMIPELDDQLQSEIYSDKIQKISIVRQKRFLPKRLAFPPGNTIMVKLPGDLIDEQSRKMQIRLKKHFNDEIKIQYYKEPSDVRMRNKNLEPITFIILRSKDLDYMKTIAKKQIEQKREEFILYDKNPQQFKHLISLPEYERFRFISNNWPDVEKYIIDSFSLHFIKESPQSITEDQLIHVFVDKLPCDLSNLIVKHMNPLQLKAANNTQFYLKSSIKDVILIYPSNHKYYYVVQSNNIENDKATKKKVREDIDLCNQFDSTKKVQIIIVSNVRQNSNNIDLLFKSLHSSQKSAADWIASTAIIQIQPDNCRPYILIDKNTYDWYYFLEKYSKLTENFRFIYASTNEGMKKSIEKIRTQDSSEEIWIIVNNLMDAEQYEKVVKKIEGGRNVSIIYHGNQKLLDQNQRKKYIFCHSGRTQVQKFILNPFRRSYSDFFPSSVDNSKVILAFVDSTSKKFKNIPLNQEELSEWRKRFKAKSVECADTSFLIKLADQNPEATVYAILDEQLDKKNRKQLQSIPNLKRILLNISSSYNPKALKNNFRTSNKQLFVGIYPAQISEYLKYLRYNIEKSQKQIETQYKKEIIKIYILEQVTLNDEVFVNYLEQKNDSIQKIRVFQPNQLHKIFDIAQKNQYNTLFIGNDDLADAVYQKNITSNTNFKYINVSARSSSSTNKVVSDNAELWTNDFDKVKNYLSNLPQNRYKRIRQFDGKFQLYFNTQNRNQNFEKIIKHIRKVATRNNRIQLQGYNDLRKLDKQIKQPSIVIITQTEQAQYHNALKNNSNAQYLVVGESFNINLASNQNKFFVGRNPREFDNFFNNLPLYYGEKIDPIPLNLDQNLDQILQSILGLQSEPMVMDQKFMKLKLHPPFTPIDFEENIRLPIPFNLSWLNQNPIKLKKIPKAVPAPPTMPLGLKWIEKIKSFKVVKKASISPLELVFDIPSDQTGKKIISQPDQDFPTFIIAPKCPKKKRFSLAILIADNQEMLTIGQMLKSNLQPNQYTVKLIFYKNEFDLEEYGKENASKLNGFDKIVAILPLESSRLDKIFKTIKFQLNQRMQYIYFDDNFYQGPHKILSSHLQPYKIRKLKLPYQNPFLPKYWNSSTNFNIFVPFENNQYRKLESAKIHVYQYQDKNQINSLLPQAGYFNIIVCNRNHYPSFKEYPKMSPRCILVVEDAADLYEDELLFDRFPRYSVYYGRDGAEYLRKILPNQIFSAPEPMKILYHLPADKDMAAKYTDFQKISFNNNQELFDYLVVKYGVVKYSHWLLQISPNPELISLQPKVYLENKQYMKDFKNNYLETGYKHRGQIAIQAKLQLKPHEFADLNQCYYTDHKQLIAMLQKDISPCVVLINGSNNKLLQLRQKNVSKYKFITLINDSQRWIDKDGYLLKVEERKLKIKQQLFLNMFNQKVFDSFNDFQYFYLSNEADVDKKFNIYFRTKENLEDIYQKIPNLLMVVFVESCDTKHIPVSLLQEASLKGGRVKIIYLHSQFIDNHKDLYVKFNEIDPVIYHINRAQLSSRVDYIVFNLKYGNEKRQEIIKQNSLEHAQNIPFLSIEDIHKISQEIKGRYKAVYVVCLEQQRALIEKIFSKYSIRSKKNSNEIVFYHYIDQLSLNQQKQYRKQMDNLIDDPQVIIYVDEQYKDKLMAGKSLSTNIQYFSDLSEMQKFKSNTVRLIITDRQFNLLNDFCTKNSSVLAVFIEDEFNSVSITDDKSPNIIILSVNQLPEIISKLKARKNPTLNSSNSQVIDQSKSNLQEKSSDSNITIDQFDTIKVVYDKAAAIEKKRKLLRSSLKHQKIFPSKFKDTNTLSQHMKDLKLLIMLMIENQNAEVQKKIQSENYNVVKRKYLKMLLPKKVKFSEKFQTIFEDVQAENQDEEEAIKILNEEQIENCLTLIEENPDEQTRKQLEIDLEKQKLLSQKANESEHNNKMVSDSILSEEEPNLFTDNQILKIKQKLKGNLIVLLIQYAKKDEVKQISNKYNILVQNYTNYLNLQNNLRDRKDSAIIVIISKKMVQKVIPLKLNYPEVIFILQNDLPQKQLLDTYKDYISGQVRTPADLQRIILEFYTQNQRIRYNQHNGMQLITKLQNKRQLSAVDWGNNQKLSVAFNNQQTKKAFLFYKDPQNNHINFKVSNEINHFVQFAPYRTVDDLKNNLDKYNSHVCIVIANREQIPEIEDYISSKKQNVFIIRFYPPNNYKGAPKIKKLFTTYKKNDLDDYLLNQFKKIGGCNLNQKTLRMNSPQIESQRLKQPSRLMSPQIDAPRSKVTEMKKYTQKYQPNTFGTSPRFNNDFVPTESVKQTYSSRYTKGTNRNFTPSKQVLKYRD